MDPLAKVILAGGAGSLRVRPSSLRQPRRVDPYYALICLRKASTASVIAVSSGQLAVHSGASVGLAAGPGSDVADQ